VSECPLKDMTEIGACMCLNALHMILLKRELECVWLRCIWYY